MGYLPPATATACAPASSAAGMPAGSVPPPWATSGLPPPRPPTDGAAALIRSPADRPRETAAGVSAAPGARGGGPPPHGDHPSPGPPPQAARPPVGPRPPAPGRGGPGGAVPPPP